MACPLPCLECLQGKAPWTTVITFPKVSNQTGMGLESYSENYSLVFKFTVKLYQLSLNTTPVLQTVVPAIKQLVNMKTYQHIL